MIVKLTQMVKKTPTIGKSDFGGWKFCNHYNQFTKMRMLQLVIALVLNQQLIAQNLVPNNSFEIHSSCPFGQNELYKAVPWFNPSISTPDYYHACSVGGMGVPNGCCGFQYALTGDAYAGFIAWSKGGLTREYLEVELTDSLISSKEYYISFYVSFAEQLSYAISNIGLYLSNAAIYSSINTNFPFIPQIENPATNYLADTIVWMKISGTYIANGGEKFITIGNFRDDTHTDTLKIYPGFFQYNYSYYFIDDVTVIDADSVQGLKEQGNICFTISPNPASEVLKITLPLNVSSTAFTIVNTMGTIVKQNESTTPQNEMVINITTLPRGVYFVKVKTNKGVGFKKFLKM
jgi:hypothetical protein